MLCFYTPNATTNANLSSTHENLKQMTFASDHGCYLSSTNENLCKPITLPQVQPATCIYSDHNKCTTTRHTRPLHSARRSNTTSLLLLSPVYVVTLQYYCRLSLPPVNDTHTADTQQLPRTNTKPSLKSLWTIPTSRA